MSDGITHRENPDPRGWRNILCMVANRRGWRIRWSRPGVDRRPCVTLTTWRWRVIAVSHAITAEEAAFDMLTKIARGIRRRA